MLLAIMQPYFFPYIGYFQLIKSVEKFVVYDDIQFTKKGWINRNRILVNGMDQYITLPLKKSSDYANINERYLADTFNDEKLKMLRKLSNSYSKAPYYQDIFPLIQKILNYEQDNLFLFLYNSLVAISAYMDIKTEFIISSTLSINTNLKGQDKVIAICENLKADVYINPIGGMELYSKEVFMEKNMILNFMQSDKIQYQQYKNEFVPWLSIIDVLMFNSKDVVKEYVNSYQLI